MSAGNATRLMRCWRAFDRRRAMVVGEQRVPRTKDEAVLNVEEGGEAWLSVFAAEEGLDMDEVLRVIGAVDRTTTPNIAALVEHGYLSDGDALRAQLAAGFAVGFFVGVAYDQGA